MPVHSFIYSIPYVLVAFISLILAIIAQFYNRGKVPLFILSCILITFLGLRGYVLTDFINYEPFFNELPNIFNLTTEDLMLYEPGFVIYSSIIKTFVDDYFIWVFINTLIDIVVLNYIFKRYSISIFLSWFFFIVYMGILMEFNLFRNMKAIDLFLLSIPYIQKRNFWKFILINSIGATIHLSALLFIPTYFFIFKRLPKTLIIILFIITNVVFLVQLFPTSYILNIIENIDPSFKALRYLTEEGEEYGLSIGYLERTAVFLFCFLYYDKLYQKNKSNVIFCNSFFIYYILFHIFADIPALTSRLPLLFIFSNWVVIPNLMGLIKSTYKASWFLLILFFGILKMVIGHSAITYKYDNILFGIDSYEVREQNVYREWQH